MTVLDNLVVSITLIVLEFIEIARLDKIMKTANTKGHRKRKSAAACESSEDESLDDLDQSEEDDYPDWKLMLKNVHGNRKLFHTDDFALHLTGLEKRYDPRVALSCHEFNTGTEQEEDPRLTRSFPTSPREYRDYVGWEHGAYGNNFDNVYADARDPIGRSPDKQFSEMGTQAAQLDISTALARKGGDLLTPGFDKDDYSRRRGQKKKRGRKNKYYK